MSNEQRVRDNPIVGDLIELIEMVSDFDGNSVPMKSVVRVIAVHAERVWYKQYGTGHFLVLLRQWKSRIDCACLIKVISEPIAGVVKE